jgi:aminoglycoside phosphotransferase (APT) family kinase protein
VAVVARLHADEVEIGEGLVRRLLAEQFPRWAELPLERVRTPGSDHVLYRLGDELVARLPRQDGVDAQVDKERTWLPRLAPHLPHSVPTPVAKGTSSAEYPFSWSIHRWLDGTNPADGVDTTELATDLARFVAALQSIDTDGGPPAGEQNFGRGAPLVSRDDATRDAIAELDGRVDAAAATAAWEDALRAPPWKEQPVWIHGDLTSENVLVVRGRLVAVIDFGCLGVGDPACDLMVAWALLTRTARSVFRAELDVDDATWARGRGWALSTGLIALPYYGKTHPPRAANARYRIAEVLADLRRPG